VTTLTTFVEVVLQDADGRKGRLMLPLVAQTVPTGLDTKIATLTALFGGNTTSFLTSSTVRQYRIIMESAESDTLPADGDIRNVWEVKASDGNHKPFKFQIPGRNTLGALTSEETKGEFIDQSSPAFDAFVTALGTGEVELWDYKNGAQAFVNSMRAASTRRQSPRL
jgi:hypothetical protein